MRPTKSAETANATTATAQKTFDTQAANTTSEQSVNDQTANLTEEQIAYRDGFQEGFLAARDGKTAPATTAAYTTVQNRTTSTPRATTRSRSVARNNSRQVYYDYAQPQPQKRSFWQKHRDKLTVAAGTGGGALLGGLIGGKKGAAIGAIAGAGGSALYTYKIRKKTPKY